MRVKSSVKHTSIREMLGLPFGASLHSSRTYRIWGSMLERCDGKHMASDRYSGRGIRVCREWRSFRRFFADMGHPPSDKHTLERQDNDSGYSKNNCRWATYAEQNRNRRDNINVKGPAGLMNLKDAAAAAGIKYGTVWRRLQRGWTHEQALNTPVRRIK